MKFWHLWMNKLTNPYLKRLIWLGCISATIPVVLAGGIYYYVSMQKLSTQFQEHSIASLTQIMDRVESVMHSVEYESLMLSSGLLMKNALESSDYITDYMLQISLLQSFQLHKNTSPFLEDILFYDRDSRSILSHFYGLTRSEDYSGFRDIEEALAMSNQARWVYLSESGREGKLSYVRYLPIMNAGESQGLLILTVREDKLRDLLRSYSLNLENQSVQVIGADGTLLLSSAGPVRDQPAITDDQIVRMAHSDSDPAGHGMLESQSGSMLYTYQEAARERLYISRLPKSEMLQQLSWIRSSIFATLIIFVLIGILLTWLSSRIVYNPIQQLLHYGEQLRRNGGQQPERTGDEIEYIRSSLDYLNEQAASLSHYISSIQPDLRERFLQRLLAAQVREDEIVEECRRHEIPSDPIYLVLVVKVENLVKQKRFLPSEGPVIVFAVKNVMAELLESQTELKGYVTDHDGREAVAILHLDGVYEPLKLREQATRYARAIHDALLRYLSFTVHVGGGMAGPLTQIHESCKAANQALQYRLFDDNRALYFYEDMIHIAQNPVFLYPKEIEREIIDLLWNGDLEQAGAALRQFSSRMSECGSYNIAFQCYHVLLSAIIQAIEEKGPGVQDLLGDNLFDQLDENQTASEMHDWFMHVLFPLHQQLSLELRTRSSLQIVQRVCQYISNMPEGLSLSECADYVQVSPSHLSRIFKKEMGTSFAQYVMLQKVQRAKQLLKETEHTITEIAEQVGYSERHLNRAFQQHLQMSPNQFRMSNR